MSAAAEHHAEIGGAPLADDVFHGHEAAGIAHIPPRIAITRDKADTRRADFNRTIVDAHAEEAERSHRTFRFLEEHRARPGLHVHAHEEIRRYRPAAFSGAHVNRDPFFADTVEAVEHFDGNDRRHVDLRAEVDVVTIAETVARLAAREGVTAGNDAVDALLLRGSVDGERYDKQSGSENPRDMTHARSFRRALQHGPCQPLRRGFSV